jgi:hypothetical protein
MVKIPEGVAAEKVKDYVSLLSVCASEMRGVDMTYKARNAGKPSSRTVDPYGHVRHDGGLSAQTILAMRLTRRTGPSDVRGTREACHNASLRKDGVMPCSLSFTIIALPGGRTFPPGTLLGRRLVSTVGHRVPACGWDEEERSGRQSALSRVPARRGGWTQHEFAD